MVAAIRLPSGGAWGENRVAGGSAERTAVVRKCRAALSGGKNGE